MNENNFNEDLAQEGLGKAKETAAQAKNLGNKLTGKLQNKIKNKAKEAALKVGKKVGQSAKKTASKAARATAKSTVRAAKLAAKLAHALGQAITAVIAAIGVPTAIVISVVLVAIIFFGGVYTVFYEERGTTGSNTVDMDIANPTVKENGVTSAIAMTEPQAVMDAYYKMLSVSSYIKTFGNDTFAFNRESTTTDFAGLRDYFRGENQFYLSDDFIRSVDELLHDNVVYYPEQVIKPVYGDKLYLTTGEEYEVSESFYADGSFAGKEVSASDMDGLIKEVYTALLPFDTADGDLILNPEIVKDFEKIYLNPKLDDDKNVFGDVLYWEILHGNFDLGNYSGIVDADLEHLAFYSGANPEKKEEAQIRFENPYLRTESQLPVQIMVESDNSDTEEVAYKFYAIDVVSDSSLDSYVDYGETGWETSVNDYGFGSVLSYEPEEKECFIECKYTTIEVAYHYYWVNLIDPRIQEETHGNTEIIPLFGTVTGMEKPIADAFSLYGADAGTVIASKTKQYPVDKDENGIVTVDELMEALAYRANYLFTEAKLQQDIQFASIDFSELTEEELAQIWILTNVVFTDFPKNLEALLDVPDNDESNDKIWQVDNEFNYEIESTYTNKEGTLRQYSNEHTDVVIADAWDLDIARTQYKNSNLERSFGNLVQLHGSYVPTKIYPVNIAVIRSAATFSGNIFYKIIPAGEDGCVETRSELKENDDYTIDHRQPVTNVIVEGYCTLQDYLAPPLEFRATRAGELVTQLPKVTAIESPWGYQYISQYVRNYFGYVPHEFMDDRDFFLRTGLESASGSDDEVANQYSENLAFLMKLDLLNLYTGEIQYTSTGMAGLGDLEDPDSDLYILSRIIAASGSLSKLDDLMIGSVFCNRAVSADFPNSFKELAQEYYPEYASVEPSDRHITSAIQVMSGQFSAPQNILHFGDIETAPYRSTVILSTSMHSYWAVGTVSEVDRFNRPAPSRGDELREQANFLPYDDSEAASMQGSGETIDSSAIFVGDTFMQEFAAIYDIDPNNLISEENATLARLNEMVQKRLANRGDPIFADIYYSGFSSVYIWAGIKSAGYPDSDFKEQYAELISSLQELYPYARIILLTLPPVGDIYSGSGIGNTHIDAKNEILYSLGCPVMDINSSLKTHGILNSEYTVDGQLLNKAGYQVVFNKIRSGAYSFTSPVQTPAEISDCYYYTDAAGNKIASPYVLYELENYDVLSATYLQADLRDMAPGVLAVFEDISDAFSSLAEKISAYFGKVDEMWGVPVSSYYISFGNQTTVGDIKDSIYHSLAFTNQITFSDAKSYADECAENGDLTFLFAGKSGLQSMVLSGTLIPGINTSIDGLISPTDIYYPMTEQISASGLKYAIVAVPANTNILAVGSGSVIEVNKTNDSYKGRYVVLEIAPGDGHIYHITLGLLNDIFVSTGNLVNAGDVIGTAGSEGLFFSVTCDGTPIDPMEHFYQPAYSYGPSLGENLYNPDGTVNTSAINALTAELTAYVNMGGGIYHSAPINTLSYLQCTWWVRGRSLQYLEMIGALGSVLTVQEFKEACWGNGGQYADYNRLAGGFAYGSTPRPNSIVCYPGDPGHVAYVEAVDYVNRVYYISHAGGGTQWLGITEKAFGSNASGSGGEYGEGIFIYLDEWLR